MLVSADSWLPYDRPKLSKNPSAKAGDILLRGEEWYKEAGVEVSQAASASSDQCCYSLHM